MKLYLGLLIEPLYTTSVLVLGGTYCMKTTLVYSYRTLPL